MQIIEKQTIQSTFFAKTKISDIQIGLCIRPGAMVDDSL